MWKHLPLWYLCEHVWSILMQYYSTFSYCHCPKQEVHFNFPSSCFESPPSSCLFVDLCHIRPVSPKTFQPWTHLSAWRCLCYFRLRGADGFSDHVWVMTDFLPQFPALCQDSGWTVAHTIVSVNNAGDRHSLFAGMIPIMCRWKEDKCNQTQVKFCVSLSGRLMVSEDWWGTNVLPQVTDQWVVFVYAHIVSGE